jgi:hypothetical protein
MSTSVLLTNQSEPRAAVIEALTAKIAQISDFFGAYPDIQNPLFNTEIARKQEFAELEPDITEARPARGGAYKHQKFAVRFLTWYDRLLLIHDPGTGKSCIITHSAELFKNEYLKNPDDPTKIRRAIILVKGPTLIENIRNEIVCKCTDRIYETELVMRSTESTIKGNITRELSTWYDIKTYGQFASIIESFEREEDLDEYMSNVAIYVDEAHNVPTLRDIRGEHHIAETIEEAEGVEQEESHYETIFRAFHRGRRNKIVLATATPMNNSPIDIIPLINLILPLNNQGFPGQMPRWRYTPEEEQRFANQPLEYFEPFFRGRVSYVRAMETGARPQPMGVQLPGYNTVVFPCGMSPFQYDVYLRASQTVQGEPHQRFFDRQRHASNFVFPDGTYGKTGFDRHVELVNDRYQFKATPEGQRCQQLVRSEEGLATLSTKYSRIVEICRNKFPQTEVVTDDSKGIVFVYFADYVHGSGAVMLGLCLREHGYEEFRETRSIFTATQEGSANSRPFGPCTTSTDSQVERPVRIPKRPRYALLSSMTPKAQIPIILNTLNSYENRYGHYIQVLIGSRTAREGINISNGIAMIMASGSWNASSNWQAQERVFRSTSLAARIAEKRARLMSQGDPAENVTIPVETYNLVAIYEGDENATDPVLQQENHNTIDPKMYLLSEEKDRLNRRIMRYLKQSSVDCYINYDRNVRPTDVDNSPLCDYLPCNYSCTGIREDLLRNMDRTTKVLFYSEEEVDNAMNAIRNLFSRYYSLKIDQIHQILNRIDQIFVDMAIEKMIRENTRVLDRMGFFGYLRESPNGVIYLEKDPFEMGAHPENTVYNSVLIGTQDPHNNSFNDYVTGLDIQKEAPLIQALIETDVNNPNFTMLLERLSLVSKVNLLEWVLYERKRTTQTDEFKDAVISAFNHAVFEIPEPIDLLRQTADQLANRGKSRGRKPNPNTQPKIKKISFDEDFPVPRFDPNIVSDRVILHTLLNQSTHDRTSYGATTRFFKAEGQLRILKMSEGIGWRNVNEYEYIVYNTLIQRQINQIRAYYEQQFSIYGIMLPPSNRLHIRDRDSENPEAASRDARSINDGRICTTWLKPDLIGILYRLNLKLPQSSMSPNITRQTMISQLRSRQELTGYPVEEFPDDRLVHFYQWYQSGFTREELCDMIRQHFERTGRLFTGKMPAQLMPNASQV